MPSSPPTNPETGRTAVTLSDAFAVKAAAATPPPVTTGTQRARVGPRARARTTSVQRVTAAGKVMWSDLRRSWWLPSSLPTVHRAWAERNPDRSRVPGNSDALYWTWLVYNHLVALPAVAAVTVLLGVLTPTVWILRHPGRLLLATAIATPI